LKSSNQFAAEFEFETTLPSKEARCDAQALVTLECATWNQLATKQLMADWTELESSVARYHGTTAALRYNFSTVPVPSALRYYLVLQYHN